MTSPASSDSRAAVEHGALLPDLNTAGIEAVDAVPGIGKKVAQAIVKQCATAPLQTWDDLEGRGIKGLGAAKLSALRAAFSLGAPALGGDVHHVDQDVAVRNLNSCSEGDLTTVVGLGPVVAARLMGERCTNGQFTGWSDLSRRVAGVSDEGAKIKHLRAAGFEVRPTLQGLLRDLGELPVGVLLARGLSQATVDAIVHARDSGSLDRELVAAVAGSNGSRGNGSGGGDWGSGGGEDEWGGDGGGGGGGGCARMLSGNAWHDVVRALMTSEAAGGGGGGGRTRGGRPRVGAEGRAEAAHGSLPGARTNGDLKGQRAAASHGKGARQWAYLYAHMEEMEPGVWWYDGVQLTKEQVAEMLARWERDYPVLPGTREHGNGREPRRPSTSSDAVRNGCWEDLLELEAQQRIPPKWRSLFRVDAYGNVVSLLAAPKYSICGFQGDHIFPWSRGGLTVRPNLAALHWLANERVKNDELLNANACHRDSGRSLVERMHVGLSMEQFLGLLEMRERIVRRSDQAKFDARMQYILWQPWACALPTLGWGKACAGTPLLRTLEPGEHTWAALVAEEAAQMEGLGLPPRAEESSDEEDEGAGM
ncbi:hypothetical protein FOA52_011525 [Chlamydomonas sp. UWO 241]|nr:hypothetical protein FOA52_011525 [Chlamydomonas sp. UWO 241]